MLLFVVLPNVAKVDMTHEYDKKSKSCRMGCQRESQVPLDKIIAFEVHDTCIKLKPSASACVAELKGLGTILICGKKQEIWASAHYTNLLCKTEFS